LDYGTEQEVASPAFLTHFLKQTNKQTKTGKKINSEELCHIF
jgi:hypothetical protein